MKQKLFHKIDSVYYATIKCPDCGKEHLVSHKNYYAQKYGKRNLSFRCGKCGQLQAARIRRNPKLMKTSHGYIKLYRPENPMADKRGEVYEHRLVMSEKLGRLLKRWEHVHHIDGNKENNSPENLELFPKSQHGTINHMKERIKYLEALLIKNHIAFD